jgi:hypothetical protein
MIECVRTEKEALGCGKVSNEHQSIEHQHDNQNMGRAAPKQKVVVFRYFECFIEMTYYKCID